MRGQGPEHAKPQSSGPQLNRFTLRQPPGILKALLLTGQDRASSYAEAPTASEVCGQMRGKPGVASCELWAAAV